MRFEEAACAGARRGESAEKERDGLVSSFTPFCVTQPREYSKRSYVSSRWESPSLGGASGILAACFRSWASQEGGKQE